jgi:hypothetical protein
LVKLMKASSLISSSQLHTMGLYGNAWSRKK